MAKKGATKKPVVRRRTRRNGHKYDVYLGGRCVGSSSTRGGADKLMERVAEGKVPNLEV